jgi:putative aldouronate transport system permease protein
MPVKIKISSGKETITYLKRYGVLYLLLLPPIVFFLVFRYAPMVNILIAFKQNNFLKPVWEVPWAANGGFEWFIKAFQKPGFFVRPAEYGDPQCSGPGPGISRADHPGNPFEPAPF